MPLHEVLLSAGARRDLNRLYDFLVDKDFDTAEPALQAMREALTLLAKFPFTCRKAAGRALGPALRELVIPFASSGYVALFEITDAETVTVLAVRHQREEDYY